MSKYKLIFKANDEGDRLKVYEDEIFKIYQFYKKYLGQEPRMSFGETPNSLGMIITWSEKGAKYKVRVTFQPSFLVDKLDDHHGEDHFSYRLFSSSELKLFDSLGFQLQPIYKHRTLDQDITDWWGNSDE